MVTVLTERYPWDFDKLKKGDRITQAELIAKSGKVPGTQEYAFWVLQLRAEVMEHKQAMGEPLVASMQKGDLVMLVDLAAAEYTHRWYRAHMRGMLRAHQMQRLVDDSEFKDGDKRRHHKRIEVNSRIIQGAMMGLRNELPAPVTERKAPALA